MDTIRKDVRDLITVNEKIQSALLQGDALNHDEVNIIRMCASELLSSLSQHHRADGTMSKGT